MNESINKYMKVGLIHFMAYPETIKGEGQIESTVKSILEDSYFDAIELTWINDDIVRKNVKKMIDTSGISIYYGAQPSLLTTGLNPNAIIEYERVKAIVMLKERIDEAAELGAKGFAFLSGKYNDITIDESFDALVKTTVSICKYAKKKGIPKVALEVFDYDVDKCALIGPVMRAKRYAEAVCSKLDNFGLMVDLSHLPLLRETAEESLVPIKDYIIHAHMGNAVVKKGLDGYGDAHPRFGFPGSSNGVEELTEYLRVLLNIGYLNSENPPVLSFEVKPFGDEDSKLVIANAKRTLNAAWARL